MRSRDTVPRAVGVELVQDISAISGPVDGFLRRFRHRVKTLFDDRTRSETFVVDYVDKAEDRRDAVIVLAYAPAGPDEPIGATRVLFRRQLRYAAFLMTGRALWAQGVAGIIEAPESPRTAAVRELEEETGLAVPPERMVPLGRAFFPMPGMLTERVYPFVAEVDPQALDDASASGDGSEMELGADLISCSLSDAMVLVDSAVTANLFICDAKTEIALRRLQAYLLERGGRTS